MEVNLLRASFFYIFEHFMKIRLNAGNVGRSLYTVVRKCYLSKYLQLYLKQLHSHY